MKNKNEKQKLILTSVDKDESKEEFKKRVIETFMKKGLIKKEKK